MKKIDCEKGKSALGGVMKRLGMACLLILGVWCMTGCDKDEELMGQTGTITYDGKTYTISVGEIGKNPNGYTYVELLGVPKIVKISGGKVVPVIGAKITAGGVTFNANGFSFIEEEGMTFYFSTTKDPETIIVYSDSGSTLVFEK
jgi:hypothetical protein